MASPPNDTQIPLDFAKKANNEPSRTPIRTESNVRSFAAATNARQIAEHESALNKLLHHAKSLSW